MGKSIREKDFFTRDAKSVAQDLLGKYLCTQDGGKYLITETEAYFHDEKDKRNKPICYGAGKTKEDAKKIVVAALFEQPGTWCVYGGQLLLSVTDACFSDNVLIKVVKNEAGEVLKPDKMAKCLHLYKSQPDYCNCHKQNSLSKASKLYLADGKKEIHITDDTRINVRDEKKLRFKIDGE